MKVAVVQIKLKTADFKFNYDNIVKNIANPENASCDLIIFPQADLADLGAKDLSVNETCLQKQAELYEKIAEQYPEKTILIGDVLIRNGEVEEVDFFEIADKKVYVGDCFRDDVMCDLYVLSKNRYFAIDTYRDFVESINAKFDFVYVNAIGMADENIFAGGSFAKNRENAVVLQMPLCIECAQVPDFNCAVAFQDEPMEKQVLDVTTFALKEYCENTGFKKVILGLSGGIDSALTAAIAVRALGATNVFGVMMPSMFSSDGSVSDSIKLAQNLGMKTEKHAITPLFENFMEKIAHYKAPDLVDLPADVALVKPAFGLAEENLQARLRGLIMMFFSNREDYLLLSTGNKSEASMGYGTLYGDLAGGYNLICDLTKTNVYKLSRFINRDIEIIPQEIIDKAPSAELRPNQKDQDSLPEYEILDDIIEMHVEQQCPIEEIYAKYDRVLVDETIRKVYRSEFKRNQCCLGVRLTERSYLNGVNLPIVQKFY